MKPSQSILRCIGRVALVVLLFASVVHAQETNCIPRPEGLVAWWPGDGTALDVVGTNHGTLQNGTSYASGKVGEAFSFDGADDFFRAPAVGMNVGTGDFSVEGWANTTSTKTWNALVSFDSYNPGLYIKGDGRLEVYPLAGSSIGGFNDGQFHHFAVVREAGIIAYFKDGEVAGSVSYGSSINPIEFLIGWGRAPGEQFPGIIDEISFYNRALTSNEIAAIYTAGISGKCRPPAVVATDPRNGMARVPTNALITATFSKPMDAATITAASFLLADSQSNSVAGMVVRAS